MCLSHSVILEIAVLEDLSANLLTGLFVGPVLPYFTVRQKVSLYP